MKADSSLLQVSQESSSGYRIALAVSSGVMLGLAFPPSPFYSLAYVGLIPVLLLIEIMKSTGQLLRYSYLTLFIFHVLTVYWTGGFVHAHDTWMMAAGVALLLVHPLFYWPSILLYTYVKKRLGLVAGLISFPFLWISYEYIHSLGEFSFPWMTLGNSQAYDLYRGQLAEYTSVYGLSFLLIVFNIIGFILLVNLGTRRWRIRSSQAITAFVVLALLYFLPWLYGARIISRYENEPGGTSLSVGVIQPNFDPWEKWGEGLINRWDAYEQQFRTFQHQTKLLVRQEPNLDLIVWPETAIPFQILLPTYSGFLQTMQETVDSVRTPIFTGLAHRMFYDSLHAPITATQSRYGNIYFDDFNSATLFEPNSYIGPIYKKIILVPFAERIPYAETFRFLIEPLKWNVGIGMWGIGKDSIMFSLPSTGSERINFSGIICYESVYPNYVRQFVKKGAQFLIIISNDSWWGNTSGAYQHASYASFRAIENRRWIIRSTNGGISTFVDPLGRLHNETRLYSAANLKGEIQPRNEQTFYTKHGDLFALVCLFCSGLFIILSISTPLRKKAIS